MGSGEEGQRREGRDACVDGGPAIAGLRPGSDIQFVAPFGGCGGCDARRVIGPDQPNKG